MLMKLTPDRENKINKMFSFYYPFKLNPSYNLKNVFVNLGYGVLVLCYSSYYSTFTDLNCTRGANMTINFKKTKIEKSASPFLDEFFK